MVTFGALQPDAEKHLTDGDRQVVGVFEGAKKVDGAVRIAAALGRNQLAQEFIVRLIALQRTAKPLMVEKSRLGPEVFTIDAEQVGPLQRPIVGVFRSPEQLVDEPSTLVGGAVG